MANNVVIPYATIESANLREDSTVVSLEHLLDDGRDDSTVHLNLGGHRAIHLVKGEGLGASFLPYLLLHMYLPPPSVALQHTGGAHLLLTGIARPGREKSN